MTVAAFCQQDRLGKAAAAHALEHVAPTDPLRASVKDGLRPRENRIDEGVRTIGIDLRLGQGPEVDETDAAGERLGQPRFAEEAG